MEAPDGCPPPVYTIMKDVSKTGYFGSEKRPH